jgi:hypothetical protein
MCPLPRLKDGLLYYGRWRWRFLGYDAMFSEDVVPLIWKSEVRNMQGGNLENNHFFEKFPIQIHRERQQNSA